MAKKQEKIDLSKFTRTKAPPLLTKHLIRKDFLDVIKNIFKLSPKKLENLLQNRANFNVGGITVSSDELADALFEMFKKYLLDWQDFSANMIDTTRTNSDWSEDQYNFWNEWQLDNDSFYEKWDTNSGNNITHITSFIAYLLHDDDTLSPSEKLKKLLGVEDNGTT